MKVALALSHLIVLVISPSFGNKSLEAYVFAKMYKYRFGTSVVND
jgi:hypothetical protein